MRWFISILLIISCNATATGWSSYGETIIEASWYVGVDPVTMAVFGHRESNFRNIRNQGGSRAAGLFQFKPTTWKYMLGRYKDEFELDETSDPYCAWTNSVLAAAYLRENEERLRGILRRDPTPAEVYMAHLLGPTGASRVLRADLNRKVTDVVPYAVNGNRRLLVRSNGKARTVGQFRDYMNWEFNELYAQYEQRVFATVTELEQNSEDYFSSFDYVALLLDSEKPALRALGNFIKDKDWFRDEIFPVIKPVLLLN